MIGLAIQAGPTDPDLGCPIVTICNAFAENRLAPILPSVN